MFLLRHFEISKNNDLWSILDISSLVHYNHERLDRQELWCIRYDSGLLSIACVGCISPECNHLLLFDGPVVGLSDAVAGYVAMGFCAGAFGVRLLEIEVWDIRRRRRLPPFGMEP
jgi:hypothetical protein